MEVNQFEADGRHKAIVPNGKLCAGGRDKYVGLDLRRNDWRTTRIAPDAAGRFKFVYYAMTPHATEYFRFYVTRDGWKPTDGLTWNNIEPFGTVKAPTVSSKNRYNMTLRLPKTKKGRHVIFAIWQRSDSKEAFYSCSDVQILAASTAAPSLRSTDDAAPVTWNEAGRAIARNDLPAGTTVSFRVFDHHGGDVERHTVVLAAGDGAADRWPAALARKVNETSSIFNIGVLADTAGSVTADPVASATENRVYRSDAFDGYTYAIDIDTP
jgi:chitin-binding protein